MPASSSSCSHSVTTVSIAVLSLVTADLDAPFHGVMKVRPPSRPQPALLVVILWGLAVLRRRGGRC